jgi:hypothetical protein
MLQSKSGVKHAVLRAEVDLGGDVAVTQVDRGQGDGFRGARLSRQDRAVERRELVLDFVSDTVFAEHHRASMIEPIRVQHQNQKY